MIDLQEDEDEDDSGNEALTVSNAASQPEKQTATTRATLGGISSLRKKSTPVGGSPGSSPMRSPMKTDRTSQTDVVSVGVILQKRQQSDKARVGNVAASLMPWQQLNTAPTLKRSTLKKEKSVASSRRDDQDEGPEHGQNEDGYIDDESQESVIWGGLGTAISTRTQSLDAGLRSLLLPRNIPSFRRPQSLNAEGRSNPRSNLTNRAGGEIPAGALSPYGRPRNIGAIRVALCPIS